MCTRPEFDTKKKCYQDDNRLETTYYFRFFTRAFCHIPAAAKTDKGPREFTLGGHLFMVACQNHTWAGESRKTPLLKIMIVYGTCGST